MTNLDALLFWIDNPGDLRSAGKEICQPLVDLKPRVIWRKYLDSQIRSSREKAFGLSLEPCRDQARFGDEGNVRRATIAVLHPESGARIQHCTQFLDLIEIDQC